MKRYFRRIGKQTGKFVRNLPWRAVAGGENTGHMITDKYDDLMAFQGKVAPPAFCACTNC